MDEQIKKIGIKAYTLKLMKEKGILEGNLYIKSELQDKNRFIKELENEGFKDGDELSCRISNYSHTIHFPRTTAKSFSQAYEFYKNNYKKGDTIVIHTLFHAKYGGTISYINNELIIEFIEGDWNFGYSSNADTAVFKDGLSTWYLYQNNRKTPYVRGSAILYKEIGPLPEAVVRNIHKNISPKLDFLIELLSGDYNSLTTLFDEDGKVQPLKLHNIESEFSKPLPFNADEVYELKTPTDLRRWDKKTKLLISIPANIDRADAMLGVISEIKKYTDEVYITYGILSHPAILLREAGLKVERKISNYKILKLEY